MNKYIENDLRDSKITMKAAIMNSLYDIDKGERTYINLGKYISHILFIECLKESKWKFPKDFLEEETECESILISPSGKSIIIIFGRNILY